MPDELDRLFECLVQVLAGDARLAVPFPAAEIYERLVPYRSNRSRIKVATHQDYEMTVLRLLAGERGYVRLEPEEVREGMQREIGSVNPDAALFRSFPDAQVMVNRIAAERFLRGEAAYAPPSAAAEQEEEEPVASADERSSVPGPSSPSDSSTFELDQPEGGSNQCPYCGGILPAGWKVNFCPHCGQPPSGELKCPACGAEVDVGWAYCVGCGRATGFE